MAEEVGITPLPGMKIEVEVTKVTVGKDGKTYVTVIHKNASNYPTLIWKD
tara:strand:- start:5039 stop:5188 length:150 start_codon:yes stop_codon:yes gene_type:complete